jgi:hypothetical protein
MRKEKIIAGVLAVATIASSVPAMTTEAVTPPGINSKFDYELNVEPVSNSQLKLTFYTTYNPGVSELGFCILYDTNKYDFAKSVTDLKAEQNSELKSIHSVNEEKGLFVWAGTFNGNGGTEQWYESTDYCEDIEICLYLNAADGDVTDESLSEFSVALASYKSQTENISETFVKAHPTMDDIHPEINLEVTPSQSIVYDYMLGDADGSGDIEISDASNIGALANNARVAGVTPSINILNHKIINNETSTFSNGKKLLWGDSFSTFIRTVQNVTFSCVEAADANRDGMITMDDSNLVLNWYSSLMTQIPVEEILEVQHKTVYY